MVTSCVNYTQLYRVVTKQFSNEIITKTFCYYVKELGSYTIVVLVREKMKKYK